MTMTVTSTDAGWAVESFSTAAGRAGDSLLQEVDPGNDKCHQESTPCCMEHARMHSSIHAIHSSVK